MTEFRTGQRVKFRRSHDKATELTGKIIELDSETGNALLETEVDGRNVEVSRIESAHLKDIRPIEEEADPFIGTASVETQAVQDDFQESTRSRRKNRG
jgi:hypothetical protein